MINTHLESSQKYAQTRIEQFRTCVKKMNQLVTKNDKALCILGGDLNIRDNEVRVKRSKIDN